MHRLFDGLLLSAPLLGAGLDWKTSLQELTAAGSLGVPEYRIAEDGPDHLKTFTATAVVAGRELGFRRGPDQEGGRAAGGRARLAGAHRGGRRRLRVLLRRRRRCPSCPRSRWSARGLAEHVLDRTIGTVEVAHPRAVRRHPPGGLDFAARLAGRTVTGVRRRGKYLWLDLDAAAEGDDAVLAHLGMSGQMLVAGPDRAGGEAPADPDRVRRRRAGAALRRPADVRRACRCTRWCRPSAAGCCRSRSRTSPGTRWTRRSTWTRRWPRVRRRRTGLKRALLDQTVVSGIGNIYADEALWRARLHYARPTERLTRAHGRAVLAAATEVMAEALAAGGTSFDALYVNVNGASGYFDRSLAVYGQADRPVPPLRHPDPARPVHEPQQLQLPALPAPPAPRAPLIPARTQRHGSAHRLQLVRGTETYARAGSNRARAGVDGRRLVGRRTPAAIQPRAPRQCRAHLPYPARMSGRARGRVTLCAREGGRIRASRGA